MDDDANRRFYSPDGEAQPLTMTTFATPASARQLLTTLDDVGSSPLGSPNSVAEDNGPEEAIIYPLGGSAN